MQEREMEMLAARRAGVTWPFPFPNSRHLFIFFIFISSFTLRFTFPCYSLLFVQLAGNAFAPFPPMLFSLTSESASYCAASAAVAQMAYCQLHTLLRMSLLSQ